MAIDLREDIGISYIQEEFLEARNIRLGLLRLDQVHPVVSGNKWFKLKENIKAAIAGKHNSILTFGGAYSNHLVAAAAAAAKACNIRSIGIVRGHHAGAAPTATLHQCMKMGMQLYYAGREEYRLKDNEDYLSGLRATYNNPFIIPEGGNNEYGLKGSKDIAAYIPPGTTTVAVAIGTGTTFRGLRSTLPVTVDMIGFPAMKGGAYLGEEIGRQLPASTFNWQLACDYHFGGFAKHSPELITFLNDFFGRHRIPLDFVYTGKMMFGLLDLIRTQQIPEGSQIIAIHTGGLQGNSSLSGKLQYVTLSDS
jgi:1-aminocyclopropane-1-carboxylate deaminase